MFEYTVKPNDTLGKIVQEQCGGGITVQKIVSDNHIANPNLIFVGQKLSLDCGNGPPPPPPSQFIDGVDASTSVNWQSAKTGGAVFGFANFFGTFGSNRNPTFDRNWTAMKTAGLIRGAYHGFLPSIDATYQANLFVNHVTLAPTDFPPVLDIEIPGTTATQVRTWLTIVENATHRKPIIYTSPGHWISSSSFGTYPLWVAHYGVQKPTLPRGWNDWTFWQPQSGAVFDPDYFKGTRADLDNFIATH